LQVTKDDLKKSTLYSIEVTGMPCTEGTIVSVQRITREVKSDGSTRTGILFTFEGGTTSFDFDDNHIVKVKDDVTEHRLNDVDVAEKSRTTESTHKVFTVKPGHAIAGPVRSVFT
jgi:hypothetical protein